ncbi:MAG: site-specific integrase [Chloroflexi bacterium]|nr:site-specific integrase [Chloroflexota bacterium]
MARHRNYAGSVVKRKDGTWQASLQVNNRRSTVYAKTKQDATQKLEEIKRAALLYHDLPQSHTLHTLLDRFLQIGQTNWKSRTIKEHGKIVAVIKREITDCNLDRVTPNRLQSLYLTLRPRTALYVHQVLHRAFALAVKWGWTFSNPCDRVDRRSYKRAEKQLWTVEQCKYFLEQARGSHWFPFFVTALLTGCRFGELAALRWSDLSLERHTITIERNLQKIDGQVIEETPKTKAGRRNVHVGEMVTNVLEQQRIQQAEWQLQSSDWQDTKNRIFTNREGVALNESAAVRALHRLCRRYELPNINVHSLRHLHASLALQAGAPLALVSQQLGHANVNITTSIYTHATGDGGLVAEALNRVLEG